ncbi:MAG: Gfo/Idh/MocA family oxidoreductase [Acidobacteriota bacterium]
MSEPLRFGVIGTGLMGVEHIQNLALQDDAKLVALSDPVERSRGWGRRAAGWDVPAYESAVEMIERHDPDALIIASPNHTHAEVLEPLWRFGKHFLVEKPLCTSLDDCRSVATRAQQHPGVFWVGMEYRYMPPIARLIDEVHDGDVLGRLHMLAIREHRFPFLPKVGDWNRFNRNSGGTLVEKCCHFFDLMRLIVRAEPVRVYASAGQSVNHLDETYDGETPDIWDNGLVTVDFDNGVRALLDLCMFAEASRYQEEITATGDRGKVECFLPKANDAECLLTLGKRESGEVRSEPIEVDAALLEAGHHHGSTYFQQAAFARAARGEDEVAVTVDDGLRAVAVGVAAQISAQEHRVVPMSEVL